MSYLLTSLLAPWFIFFQTLGTVPQEEIGRESFKEAWFLETFEKNIPEAISAYERVRNQYPNTFFGAKALGRLIQLYIKNDRFDEAKALLEELQRTYPDQKKLYNQLSKKLRKATTKEEEPKRERNPATEDEITDEIFDQNPGETNDPIAKIEALLEEAKKLRRQGRYEQADLLMKQALSMSARLRKLNAKEKDPTKISREDQKRIRKIKAGEQKRTPKVSQDEQIRLRNKKVKGERLENPRNDNRRGVEVKKQRGVERPKRPRNETPPKKETRKKVESSDRG